MTTLFNNTLNVTIGSRPDGTTAFNGLVDSVRLYNEALTEAQIQALPEMVQTPLAFTLQPASGTVVEYRSTTFSAAITGSLPYYIPAYPVVTLSHLAWLVIGAFSRSKCDNRISRLYSMVRKRCANSQCEPPDLHHPLGFALDERLPVQCGRQQPRLEHHQHQRHPHRQFRHQLAHPPFRGQRGRQFRGVCFNELMDPNLLFDPSHFTVNGGAVSVSSSLPRPDGVSAVLTLSAPVAGTFSLVVTGVTDLVGNTIAPGSSAVGSVAGLSFSDVGSPLPNQIGDAFSCKTDEYEMTAGGSDFGGGSDSGHFASRQVSGHFDVSVQVPNLTPVNSISQAGLLVRQTLDANSPTLHLMANPPPPTGRGYIEALRRPTVGGATTGWGTTFTAAVMPQGR